MKLIFGILVLAALSTAEPSLCVEKLPDGADPSQVRMYPPLALLPKLRLYKYNICREHPNGRNLHLATQPLQTKVQTPEEIALECGDLGVMEVPPGADASKVCLCEDTSLSLVFLC